MRRRRFVAGARARFVCGAARPSLRPRALRAQRFDRVATAARRCRDQSRTHPSRPAFDAEARQRALHAAVVPRPQPGDGQKRSRMAPASSPPRSENSPSRAPPGLSENYQTRARKLAFASPAFVAMSIVTGHATAPRSSEASWKREENQGRRAIRGQRGCAQKPVEMKRATNTIQRTNERTNEREKERKRERRKERKKERKKMYGKKKKKGEGTLRRALAAQAHRARRSVHRDLGVAGVDGAADRLEVLELVERQAARQERRDGRDGRRRRQRGGRSRRGRGRRERRGRARKGCGRSGGRDPVRTEGRIRALAVPPERGRGDSPATSPTPPPAALHPRCPTKRRGLATGPGRASPVAPRCPTAGLAARLVAGRPTNELRDSAMGSQPRAPSKATRDGRFRETSRTCGGGARQADGRDVSKGNGAGRGGQPASAGESHGKSRGGEEDEGERRERERGSERTRGYSAERRRPLGFFNPPRPEGISKSPRSPALRWCPDPRRICGPRGRRAVSRAQRGLSSEFSAACPRFDASC